MSDIKRYIVIVKLKEGSDRDRIVRDAPEIVALIHRFSNGEHEVVFQADFGALFAFFIKSDRIQFLQAEFEKCKGTINGDAMLAFEAGPLASGVGFSRAWTWLQRH